MTRYFNRLENTPDDPRFVYNEGRSLRVARRIGQDTQRCADAAVGISQQWRRNALPLRKLAVRLDRVARDADQCSVDSGEVSRPLTEVTCFVRSARRAVFRVCPENYRFRAAEVGEIQRTVLCLAADWWKRLADLDCHWFSLAAYEAAGPLAVLLERAM